MPDNVAETLLLVIALTMLMTPLLFHAYWGAFRKRSAEGTIRPLALTTKSNAQGPVIIAGIGRFGQIVNRLVQASGFETVVLDHDIRNTIAADAPFWHQERFWAIPRALMLRCAQAGSS